jgi:hypothetical protein
MKTNFRTANSVVAVSQWYIPGGADYSNAKVVKWFFDSQEEAEAHVKKYEKPPELAVLVPLE